MAVYSKLSLSAGGGIVSTQQQADQAKNTASLLIGIGGTGIDCLRTIKTQVYSRLKPDDPEAIVATYSHIRFLGLDTTEQTQGDTDEDDENNADSLLSLDDTEFFCIADPGVKRAFKNSNALKARSELSWLRWEDIEAPNLTKEGAGGKRQVGRYMLMNKSSAFLTRLEQEINTAKRGLANPSVNIHIFAGLSGGTGAGCFLDVCYMVKSIAERVGGVTTFGYFFLPDVNLDKIPMSKTKTRAYVPKNGYASMQELDYCMQLQYNGGSFVQEYQGHKKIEWKTGPVDMCHLVCATNSDGDVIENAYDYAMNVTTEYIMDFLTYSNTPMGLSQQWANFLAEVGEADQQKHIGSNLAYCVIGASCASIPLREINTYLASELFARFATIGNAVPTQRDVENLAIQALAKGVSNITEVYQSLYREIREGADDTFTQYVDDWKFVRDYGNSEFELNYTNQRAEKGNRIAANKASMTSTGNANSLIGRVMNYLDKACCDINRGPIFAFDMISAAEDHNLLNIIDGLIEENDKKYTAEKAQYSLRHKNFEDAKADFENRRRRSVLDNDAKRFNDYEYYRMLLEQHLLLVDVYEELDSVLQTFRNQVIEAAGAYYIKLARVIGTLIQTFRENSDALASEKVLQKKGSFSIPLMTIAELKPSLDNEIKNINVPGMMDSFMRLFLNNPDEWLSEDENKISKLVTDFFVKTAFNDFANRTITAFLMDKYQTTNVAVLTDRVFEEWMKLLASKASPLFFFNNTIWQEHDTSRLAFVSIPSSSAPIKAAAQKLYSTDDQWVTKDSALTDRIYIMCSACALPLSAYNNLETYETDYFSSNDCGRHYYEGKPIDGMIFDDWRNLPSLTPQSMIQMEYAPDKLKKSVQKACELYDLAEAAHVFDNQNRICRISEEDANTIKKLAKVCEELAASISKPEDLSKAQHALDELTAAMGYELIPTEYAMQNDGHAEKEETKNSVRKDHFVSAPAYHIRVEAILKEISEVKDIAELAKTKLTDKMNRIGQGGKDLNDYCDAVFSGVISIEGRQVIYHQTNYGIATDHVLSKRGGEFTYGSIPVYQGFLSYQTLDANIKNEIKNIANKRLDTDAPELVSTAEQLKEVFADDRINAWAQLAAEYPNRMEIVEFLGKLKKLFNIFCLETL